MSELSDAKALENLHPTVKYICEQLNRVVEQESELALLRSKMERAMEALERNKQSVSNLGCDCITQDGPCLRCEIEGVSKKALASLREGKEKP